MADLIDGIAARLGNEWPQHRQECIVADKIGKPAFWTKTGAERATVMLLAQRATLDSLANAMRRYWIASDTIEAEREMLDQLIPLNHEAVMQLRMAYAGTGSYPRLAELHDRRNVPDCFRPKV
jgi:hypothetical protein